MEQSKVERLDKETDRIFKQIAEETGVEKDDVARVLKRLGLYQSIDMLTEVTGHEIIGKINIDGVIAGIKVARIPVHA